MAPLTYIFTDIERERQWEPTFPARYLLGDTKSTKVKPLPAEILLSGMSITDESTLSRSAATEGTPHPTIKADGSIKSTMV